MRNLAPHLKLNIRGIKDENGLVHDFSGNGLHGTITNALIVEGRDGMAMRFDALDDRVLISDNAAIQNIFDGGGSISIWVKPDSDGENSEGRIIDKSSIALYLQNEAAGKTEIRFNQNFSDTNGGWSTTATELPISSWSSIVVVYDNGAVGNDPVIYVNGIQVVLTEDSTPVGTRTTDVGSDLYIGDNVASDRCFDGDIEGLQFYDTELAADEAEVLAGRSPRSLITVPVGKMRRILRFDGVNDSLSIADGSQTGLDFGTNDIILSAWIRTVSTDKQPIVYKFGAGGYYDFHINVTTGFLECEINDGGNTATITGDVAVNDGNVHHVACSIDKSSITGGRLYVDTIEDESARTDVTAVGDIDNDGAFRIGTDGTDYFEGIIATVRVFDAISAVQLEDIEELYKKVDSSVSLSGEQGHWPLDETQSFKIFDETGNNNDLIQVTVANQPTVIHDLGLPYRYDPIFYEPLRDAKITNRWVMQSGMFEPVYDSSQKTYGIRCTSAGNSTIVLREGAEERFETSWKMKKAAGTAPYLQFVANKPTDRATSGSYGYYFIMNVDGSVGLYKYNAGSYFELFSTGASYVNDDQWYDIRISVTAGGVFTGYIDNLEVVETSGSNPTEVDMTYVNSRYLVIGTGIGDVMSNFQAKRKMGLAYDPYVIGIPGDLGFGAAAVVSEEYIPDGMTAMSGCNHRDSDNYGNYQYADGSILVFIPKFYYKITAGTNNIDVKGTDTYRSTAAANADGYALHRAFIDGGVEQPGFFVDKYKCSKNAWGAGYIGSSIKNGDPISTHADHNPIADLTACGTNAYFQVIDAAHARDGVDGAINPSSVFFAGSRFIHSALAILSLAHGQASTATTNCAWYNATYNYPKGCNDDALGDVDDGTVSYTGDGYLNCGKTGSGTPFAKTTHNGQNCGVADVNGLMWEVALGLTCITAGGGTIEDISRANPANVQITGHGLSTDDYVMLTGIEGGDWADLDDKIYKIIKVNNDNFTLNGVDASGFTLAYVQGTNHGTITAGSFYLAKEATAMKDFTSGTAAATDHWGATGVAAMMESFIPAFETSYAVNGFGQRYGSGANQVLSEAVSGSGWKLTGMAIPKDANGIDATGTNQFGKDYYYQYIRNQLCGLSFGYWLYGSSAGVWALAWYSGRPDSSYIVGWRAACYPL